MESWNKPYLVENKRKNVINVRRQTPIPESSRWAAQWPTAFASCLNVEVGETADVPEVAHLGLHSDSRGHQVLMILLCDIFMNQGLFWTSHWWTGAQGQRLRRAATVLPQHHPYEPQALVPSTRVCMASIAALPVNMADSPGAWHCDCRRSGLCSLRFPGQVFCLVDGFMGFSLIWPCEIIGLLSPLLDPSRCPSRGYSLFQTRFTVYLSQEIFLPKLPPKPLPFLWTLWEFPEAILCFFELVPASLWGLCPSVFHDVK